MEESQVELHGRASVAGAAGAGAIRRSGKAKYRSALGKHRIAKEGWSIGATEDLTVAPVPALQRASRRSIRRRCGAAQPDLHDPGKAAGLKIVRLSELS